MGGSEWEALLQRRLAYLPGPRDVGGGPIMVVPLPADPADQDVGGISVTLKYLKTIPSVTSVERGWVVVVDARHCHYRYVKHATSTIKAALGNIRLLLVLRADGFWDKQRVDCRKAEVDNQPVYTTATKISRYIELSRLPTELGGTLEYCHATWIKMRKAYEEFVEECESCHRELEALQKELRREEPCTTATSLHRLLQATAPAHTAATTHPHHVIKMGEAALRVLEEDAESGFPVTGRGTDWPEAGRRVRAMLRALRLLASAVDATWRRLNAALVMHNEVRSVEGEMSDIGSWLESAGRTLLGEARIGGNSAQADQLLREHEAIELKCRETYGRWAALRYRVEDCLSRGEGELRALADHTSTTADLKALKEYTDTLVRSFASRLDRRRTVILASVRFHRMTQYIGERCGVVHQPGRWAPDTKDVVMLKATLKELTSRREVLDYLMGEASRCGEKLLDLLTMAVKDLSGRDVTPDYTAELNHVHALLTTSTRLYTDACRHADVSKLQLQQHAQLLTCHQDVKQAHTWLQELLGALVKSHSMIGRSVEEIRQLKEDHQLFQNTATGTFEYGYECARAALLVERAGSGSSSSSSSQSPPREGGTASESSSPPLQKDSGAVAALEAVWKLFVQGSQEQLTRLRVAGVFYRTMEQHLARLEALCKSVVEARSRAPAAVGLEAEAGRQLMAQRDRLLREIGRNIRLGKLLKERLMEPLVPSYSRELHENLLAQEAISERISHISGRARHLDSLLLPASATGTHSSTLAAMDQSPTSSLSPEPPLVSPPPLPPSSVGSGSPVRNGSPPGSTRMSPPLPPPPPSIAGPSSSGQGAAPGGSGDEHEVSSAF